MTLRLILGGSKGGIGRTTTTANTAMAFALKGKKVLLLDLDAQSNLTNIMGKTYYRRTGEQMTINQTMLYSLVHHDLNDSVVRIMKNLYLVPSSFNFRHYPEVLLKLLMGKSKDIKDFEHKRISYLANEMKPVEAEYKPDVVMVDLPPSPDIFESSGIYYIGDHENPGNIIYIIQVQSFSYDGARQFRKFTQSLLNKYPELKLNVAGAIPTMFDRYSSSENDVISKMKHDFSGGAKGLLLNPILYRERLKHYSISGIPTPNHDFHDMKIKGMFSKLADEILRNIKLINESTKEDK